MQGHMREIGALWVAHTVNKLYVKGVWGMWRGVWRGVYACVYVCEDVRGCA